MAEGLLGARSGGAHAGGRVLRPEPAKLNKGPASYVLQARPPADQGPAPTPGLVLVGGALQELVPRREDIAVIGDGRAELGPNAARQDDQRQQPQQPLRGLDHDRPLHMAGPLPAVSASLLDCAILPAPPPKTQQLVPANSDQRFGKPHEIPMFTHANLV